MSAINRKLSVNHHLRRSENDISLFKRFTTHLSKASPNKPSHQPKAKSPRTDIRPPSETNYNYIQQKVVDYDDCNLDARDSEDHIRAIPSSFPPFRANNVNSVITKPTFCTTSGCTSTKNKQHIFGHLL